MIGREIDMIDKQLIEYNLMIVIVINNRYRCQTGRQADRQMSAGKNPGFCYCLTLSCDASREFCVDNSGHILMVSEVKELQSKDSRLQSQHESGDELEFQAEQLVLALVLSGISSLCVSGASLQVFSFYPSVGFIQWLQVLLLAISSINQAL